jgi:hypothetical protein
VRDQARLPVVGLGGALTGGWCIIGGDIFGGIFGILAESICFCFALVPVSYFVLLGRHDLLSL